MNLNASLGNEIREGHCVPSVKKKNDLQTLIVLMIFFPRFPVNWTAKLTKFPNKYPSVVSDNTATLLGPANFSAKHPKITHKFRSFRGVRLSECVIISATSSTESLVGNGLSSSNSVITLGPIGCSIGTTRTNDLTNCIHPVGLSVISCNCIIDVGGSGSLKQNETQKCHFRNTLCELQVKKCLLVDYRANYFQCFFN